MVMVYSSTLGDFVRANVGKYPIFWDRPNSSGDIK